MRNTHIRSLLALAALTCTAFADEGMWLLSKPPVAAIKSSLGVDITPAWLEHVQKSAVRFDTGGSGSVVSADGLVMTNHHVGSDMLQKLSTPDNNLLAKGFFAGKQEGELKCPDLVLDILWEIEDVTEKVNAEAKNASDPAAAGAARRRAISTIENESKQKSGLKSEVVTLFQGGQYHLYRYRSYTDIRLVFAPEEQAAFFGGDTDNFEFPRFNLDCCFFRIYENGKPLKAEHHLTWSKSGAAEDEAIFVAGHPGRTRRLYTTNHLKFIRDIQLPATLANLWRQEMKDQAFAGRSAENARIVRDDMFGVANSRKAYTGLLEGLQNPALMGIKETKEKALRDHVGADATMRDKYGEAWEKIAEAEGAYAEIFLEKYTVDGVIRSSKLLSQAMHIVRLADELALPSEQRLKEYNQAGLDQLYMQLYSPEPVYDALAVHELSIQLSRLAEVLGGDDEVVTEVFDGKSPSARARELVEKCTFKTPAACKKLVEGGKSALEDSKDPLIEMAKALDPLSRELRKQYEDEVESVERASYAQIAAAKFAVEGDSVYPDATFTLRLAYGKVKGVGAVKPFTDLAGMFARGAERKGEADFALPQSWIAAKDKIDLATPFNFICTADIIGGNSGSPVVNKNGELVGLIFDGNLDSLVGDVVYDAANARAVAVDSRGLIEAIRKIYHADTLADELQK